MRGLEEIKDNPKITVQQSSDDGFKGWVNVGKGLGNAPYFVCSNGGGWDHVSVSYANRCPTWDEMCKVKEIFFYDDECCVEYHPAKKNYVNVHNYCLHIWKPQKEALPTPPILFV